MNISQRTTKPTIRLVTNKDSDQPLYPPSKAMVLVYCVCVEALRPSQPNGGHVERGQFT